MYTEQFGVDIVKYQRLLITSFLALLPADSSRTHSPGSGNVVPIIYSFLIYTFVTK